MLKKIKISREQVEENIMSQLVYKPKPKKRKKKLKTTLSEDDVQIQLVSYLNDKYPDILYKADTSTGGFTSIGMAVKQKRLGGNVTNFPDIAIYKKNKLSTVLFIEIKREDVKIYKQNDVHYKNKHQEDQSSMLKKLENEGYVASFGIGFKHCKEIVDAYLNEDEEKLKEIKIT